jgi:hypothetical protein
MPMSLTTVLSVVVYFDAFGWAIGVILTLYYAFTRRTLPTVGGSDS